MWIRSAFSTVTGPARARWLVGAMVAVAVGGVALYVTRPPATFHTLAPSNSPDPLRDTEIQTILEPDAIAAVDHPRFVTAEKSRMRENLSVIGVELGSEAHAFPIAFMSQVEIVNDRLGGTNIAVTW